MGMNKYSSILRTYVFRNHYEAALTSGTDIVVPAASTGYRNCPRLTMDISAETNFSVERIGVFSNFADGLVFKDPSDRFDVALFPVAYALANNSFTLDFTYGSKAVTVSVGTTGWVGGTRYDVAVQEPVSGRIMVVSVDATGAAAGNLDDYWQYGTGSNPSYALTVAGAPLPYQMKNISTLNCMYELAEFAQPLVFSGGGDYDYIGIRTGLNFISGHNTTLLTHTIDSAFDGNTVCFDVVLDVEFTVR